MEIVELLIEVVPLILSALATTVAFLKGRTKKTATKEEIAEKAQTKANKYFAKQCKKYNLQVEDTGGANETKNEG